MENFRHSLDDPPQGFVFQHSHEKHVVDRTEIYNFSELNKAIALQSDLEELDLTKKRLRAGAQDTIRALSKLYGGFWMMPSGVAQSVHDNFK